MTDQKDADFVSIIIVNFNGKKHLEKCLESLKKISYPNFETILIDNNSDDGSIEFVESNFPSIKLIKLEQNLGFTEANNIGAKDAIGKYLFFLNNDTITTHNSIDELVKTMKSDPKIAISQSLLLKPSGSVDSSGDFIDTLGRAYSSKDRHPNFQNILSARGAALMIQKNIFWKLEGFDKEFFATFEDVDLGWRAWLYGYRVVIVPNSIIYHVGGQTIKKINSLIQFHGVKNTLIIRLTNFEFNFSFKSILLLFFVSLMKKLFKISVVKDPEEPPKLPSMKIILRGVFWIIKNQSYVRKKRRLLKNNKILSTNDLIKQGVITKYSFN